MHDTTFFTSFSSATSSCPIFSSVSSSHCSCQFRTCSPFSPIIYFRILSSMLFLSFSDTSTSYLQHPDSDSACLLLLQSLLLSIEALPALLLSLILSVNPYASGHLIITSCFSLLFVSAYHHISHSFQITSLSIAIHSLLDCILHSTSSSASSRNHPLLLHSLIKPQRQQNKEKTTTTTSFQSFASNFRSDCPLVAALTYFALFFPLLFFRAFPTCSKANSHDSVCLIRLSLFSSYNSISFSSFSTFFFLFFTLRFL